MVYNLTDNSIGSFEVRLPHRLRGAVDYCDSHMTSLAGCSTNCDQASDSQGARSGGRKSSGGRASGRGQRPPQVHPDRPSHLWRSGPQGPPNVFLMNIVDHLPRSHWASSFFVFSSLTQVVDLFLHSTHAVGLVGVGCCYQLTTSLIGERTFAPLTHFCPQRQT